MAAPLDTRFARLLAALTPRLTGATLRERLIAGVGALLGIALTGLLCGLIVHGGVGAPLLVGPLGASAVLLFAVPASPLAQPWSIVGGNTISAFVGLGVAAVIPEPTLAAGVAVGSAILVMSALRCLHPPGGAVALTIALGGPAVGAGVSFALVPVGLDSLMLVGLGLVFHRLTRRAYPHVARPPAILHGTVDRALTEADIDAAIAAEGEAFDIQRGDLARLIRRAEQAAIERTSTGAR